MLWGLGGFLVNFKGHLDNGQEICSILGGESHCYFPLSVDGLTCTLFGVSAVSDPGRWLPPINCPPDQRVINEGDNFWGWQ